MKKLTLLIATIFLLAMPLNGYAQQTLYGDVNGDLEINIADVNVVIDLILDGTGYTPAADINSDGEINIADINVIIDIILGGSPKTLCSTLLVTTRDGRTVEHIIDQNTRIATKVIK